MLFVLQYMIPGVFAIDDYNGIVLIKTKKHPWTIFTLHGETRGFLRRLRCVLIMKERIAGVYNVQGLLIYLQRGVNLIKMCSHWLKLLFSPASIVAFSLTHSPSLSLPPSPPLSVSRLQLSHHSSDYVPSNEKDLILYAAGERALAGHAIKDAVRVERESICVYLDKHNHAMIIIDFNTHPFSIPFSLAIGLYNNCVSSYGSYIWSHTGG